MREFYKASVSPQQKMVAVNNKLGNNTIKFQQGTSRTLYDTLPYTTDGQTFRFFEDSASRQFPFSNTGSDGNKLGVGETMVISEIFFTVLTYDPATLRYSAFNVFSENAMVGSILNFELGNSRVIKNYPLFDYLPNYSKNESTSSQVIQLDTAIVVPPLINFVCGLQLGRDTVAPAANTFLRCTIHGAAGILAPRNTF